MCALRPRILAVGLLAWLGIACASRDLDKSQRAVLHMQLGGGHLSKGNVPSALAEFLKARELDPNNPFVANNLGLAYYLRGRVDLAEKSFRDALELNPKFTEARNNLGRALISQKKYSDAVKELRVASSDLVYPQPEKVLANLGIAHFHLGEFTIAERELQKSLANQRQNCLGWSFYGRTLYELSSFAKAAESLDTAIRQCKELKSDEPYYFAALSFMKIGKREEAIARLEEGLGIAPNGTYAQKARSMLEILK